MECTVKWLDGMTFIAATGSNHAIIMDGAPEGGGRNLAPRPMELILAGTGGCSEPVKKSACGSGLARDISTQSCSYRGQGRSHNEKFTTSQPTMSS